MYRDLLVRVIMIDALYCRSTAVLLAMHVWLYVVAVLYMVSDAGRPHGAELAAPITAGSLWGTGVRSALPPPRPRGIAT